MEYLVRHPTIERVGQQIGYSYQRGVSALLYTQRSRVAGLDRLRHSVCDLTVIVRQHFADTPCPNERGS
jgi:hypothetical protein